MKMENKKLGLTGPKEISQWSEKSFSSGREKKMKKVLHESVDLLAIERTLENLKETIPDSSVLDNYISAMKKFEKTSKGIKIQEGVYL